MNEIIAVVDPGERQTKESGVFIDKNNCRFHVDENGCRTFWDVCTGEKSKIPASDEVAIGKLIGSHPVYTTHVERMFMRLDDPDSVVILFSKIKRFVHRLTKSAGNLTSRVPR